MKKMRRLSLSIFLVMALLLLFASCSLSFDKICSHTFGEWETTATCLESGTSTRTCSKCGYVETKEQEALGHDYQVISGTPATCTSAGDVELKCTRCEDEKSEHQNALGHQLEHHEALAPTCTETGYDAYDKCTRDGCTYTTYTEQSALGHQIVHHNGEEATCEHEGCKAYDTCSRSGCTYTTYEAIAKLDHEYENGVCIHCGYLSLPSFAGDYGYNYLSSQTKSSDMLGLYNKMDLVQQGIFSSTTNFTELYEVNGTNYVVCNKLSFQEFPSLNGTDVQLVWKCFNADHPLYFWMGRAMSIQNKTVYLLCDTEYAIGSIRNTLANTLLNTIVEILEPIENESSKYLKALYFHDTLISYVNYSYKSDGVTPETENWAHNIEGILTKRGAVCEGYAKAFQLLLNASGIDNVFVTGIGSSEAHAWNLIQLEDEKWYWCDLTWDDTPGWEFGARYNYFCVSENENINQFDGGYYQNVGTFLDNHRPYGVSDGDSYIFPLPSRSTTSFSSSITMYDTFTVGKIQYALCGFGKVQVVGFSLTNMDSFLTTAISIPETVQYQNRTYTVCAIGGLDNNNRFNINSISSSYSINKITLPKTIEFIWDGSICFESLQEIVVDSENPYFTSLDGVLFTKNLGTLVAYPDKKSGSSYALPNQTTSIGYSAFGKTKNLTQLTLGDSFKTANRIAGPYGYLEDMSQSRDSRDYEEALALIRNRNTNNSSFVFAVTSDNPYYKVEDGLLLSKDGKTVYSAAYSITSVQVTGVEKITRYAFLYCTKISSISFSNALVSISEDAFANSNIRTINYSGTSSQWNAIEKEDNWNRSSKITSIVCSDTTITP